jgi:predicted component of type VI protein secretion system
VEKAYLEFTRDGRQEVVALDASQLTLGRAGDNDLAFPSDGTVSGKHAILERQDEGWTIRDLNSANGTYVNGQRVDGSALLRPGDTVTVGKARLAFRIPQTLLSLPDAAEPAGYLAVTEEWAAPSQGPAQSPDPPRPPPAGDAMGPGQQPAGAGAGRPAPGPAPYVPLAMPQINHGGSAVIRGTARDVKSGRRQNDAVLRFRVERYDSSGNRLPPVAVEFIGWRSGQISAGEQVEVAGHWSRGTLRAQSVINLSTNAVVQGRTFAIKAGRALFYVIFAVICLIILTFFVASFA